MLGDTIDNIAYSCCYISLLATACVIVYGILSGWQASGNTASTEIMSHSVF